MKTPEYYTLSAKLIHAATRFDARRAKKPGYNPWALPQYMQAVDRAMHNIDNGAEPRAAICAAFSDRLLDAMLKAGGFETSTKKECQHIGKPVCYTPAANPNAGISPAFPKGRW